MSKTPKQGPGHSRERQWSVILEDIQSQFRVFGDELKTINRRLGGIETDVAVLKNDVSILKTDVSILKTDVSILKTDVSILKSKMGFIEKVIPTIATKDDLIPLERRILVLEKAS